MVKYTKQQLSDALKVVSSTITNCEKMQPKFEVGTSQHSLLKNRIKALYISQALINCEEIIDKYTKEELLNALPPVESIISKSEKGQEKHKEGTSTHTRFKKIIDAMYISKVMIDEEINKID